MKYLEENEIKESLKFMEESTTLKYLSNEFLININYEGHHYHHPKYVTSEDKLWINVKPKCSNVIEHIYVVVCHNDKDNFMFEEEFTFKRVLNDKPTTDEIINRALGKVAMKYRPKYE